MADGARLGAEVAFHARLTPPAGLLRFSGVDAGLDTGLWLTSGRLWDEISDAFQGR